MGGVARGFLALGLAIAFAIAGCGDSTTTAGPTPIGPAATVSSSASSTASAGPPTLDSFTPGSVSMWSRQSYLLAGATAVNPGSNVTITGVVAGTNDEGRTWSLVAVDPLPIVGISVGPTDEAWALGSSADGSTPAPVFRSTDAGVTWAKLPTPPALFSTIAFSFDGHGYGLATKPGTEDDVTGVYATDDGGSTWTSLVNPCPGATGVVGLATSDEHSAWVGCVGEPGTIEQPKAIRWTNNVGVTWNTTGFVNPVDGSHLGNIPSSGHLTGLASGRGGNLWALLERGLPILSSDAGLTWTETHLGEVDVSAAIAMTRDDHRESLALLWNPDAQAIQLMRSYDEGDTWELVRAFPMGN